MLNWHMGNQPFEDFRFELGRLLQGQRRVYHFKLDLTPLLSVLEVANVKLAYRKSCIADLMVILDLTLGASFKVKGESITFKWP